MHATAVIGCFVILTKTKLWTVLHSSSRDMWCVKNKFWTLYVTGMVRYWYWFWMKENSFFMLLWTFYFYRNFRPNYHSSISLYIIFLLVNGHQMRFVFFSIVCSKWLSFICTQFAFVQETSGMFVAFDHVFSQIFLENGRKKAFKKSFFKHKTFWRME